MRSRGSTLFPNLYTLLVSPPAIGKSNIIAFSERLLRHIEELFIAPSSLTSASLVDTLSDSVRKIMFPQFVQFNSLQVLSSELQNFLPAYEASFMGVLTKLYDCELYEERRRTGRVTHLKIDNTQLSILAGTTPSYLSGFLPEGAWDQGFMSRTIMIYCDESLDSNLWNEPDRQEREEGHADLVADLHEMMKYQGQVMWAQDAREAAQHWNSTGRKPEPQHARLRYYNGRRMVHALKLSMVACAARADTTMEVQAEDFETAKGWLLEAEATIPMIFQSMIVTAESRTMQDAHYHLTQIYERTQKPVPEHYLINFLKDRIPSHSLGKVIEMMVRARMLKQEFNSPTPCYTPIKQS